MVVSSISDHALLRWMERRHGIDVETWRRLMIDDVNAALVHYTGHRATHGPAHILAHDGSQVITYITEGWKIPDRIDGVAIQALDQAEDEEAA